jgi:Flp pilus assembly protein TadG
MMKKRKQERGQALVEFALTIVFLMVLLLAFIELIVMFYTYVVLADAAKEGVRYAIVHGSLSSTQSGPPKSGSPTTSSPPCTSSSSNVGNVQTAVKQYAAMSLHSTAGMTVNVCYFDGENVSPDRVGVSVRYGYQPFFGLGWPSVTVNAAADGRIMY